MRQRISQHVAKVFPGCHAEFVGSQSAAALVSRTFGFKVKDGKGRYRSNIIWLDPAYEGPIDEGWVIAAVKTSNGR